MVILLNTNDNFGMQNQTRREMSKCRIREAQLLWFHIKHIYEVNILQMTTYLALTTITKPRKSKKKQSSFRKYTSHITIITGRLHVAANKD